VSAVDSSMKLAFFFIMITTKTREFPELTKQMLCPCSTMLHIAVRWRLWRPFAKVGVYTIFPFHACHSLSLSLCMCHVFNSLSSYTLSQRLDKHTKYIRAGLWVRVAKARANLLSMRYQLARKHDTYITRAREDDIRSFRPHTLVA
jgi:hypothetical protein